MPHNTPWSKKEMKMLIELLEGGNDYSRASWVLNELFGNNRTESACRTIYQKLKEK